VMAGAFTQANAALLSQRLGRSPSEGELYIAHFLGAGGAARLISAAAGNPSGSAASYFPNAAQANPSIFYDRTTGAARSLAQVRDVLTARYDVAARRPIETINPAQAATVPTANSALRNTPIASSVPAIPVVIGPKAPGPVPVAMVPDTAGMTNAFADAAPKRVAQENQIFHGLFSDPGRGPVAEVVSQLWGVSNAAPLGVSGAMHDLFKDNEEGG
jgi:hypothetical protein